MAARRAWLKISALVMLLGFAAIALFVATFDLNRYRSVVERGIAGALHRPVEIGEAHLSVRHGLAIDLTGLHIGPRKPGGSELAAEHLFLKLDLKDLLTGRVTVEEVILAKPDIRLTLPSPEPAEPHPPEPSALFSGRLHTARIEILRLEGGTFRIDDRRGRQPRTLLVEKISGQLAGAGMGRSGAIRLAGELAQPGGPASIDLSGEVGIPSDPGRWHETDLALTLKLRDFRPAHLRGLFADDSGIECLSGQSTLNLQLAGSPGTGLHLAGTLSESLKLDIPGHYRNPLLLPAASFAGIWTYTDDFHRLSDLELNAGELTMHGELALEKKRDGHRLEADFSTPPLPLSALARYLPDAVRPEPPARISERLVGGTFQLDNLRLEGPLGENPVKEAQGRIRDLTLALPHLGDLEKLATDLIWRKGRLEFQEGRFRLAGAEQRFAGSLSLSGERPEISLEAHGTLPTERLISLLPYRDRAEIDAKGPIPVSLEVSGRPDRLLIDLKSDLKFLAIDFESKLRKPAGLEAQLFATAELTPEQLVLNHGLLSIPPMELRARGALRRAPGHPFELTLDLAPLDMQQARFRTPLLDRFEPEGRLALTYRLAGSGGTLREQGGKLLLRGFGMRVPGPVGNLNGADGEIEIEGGRATISRLAGRIGDSSVSVTGKFDAADDPRLDLEIRSPSIRANDLIFPSKELVFQDVTGHLSITRRGITFSPVTVRLGEDTVATVRGTLENFKAPEVRLEIEAERADIMDVIGLWKRPPDAQRPPTRKKRKMQVVIDARVGEGTLGPLHFRNARGRIVTRGEHLVIHPLRFDSGQGTCSGQVVIDRSGPPPALLKISGHLRNLGAAALHHELLKKRGLITGTLHGDFYIEGRVGPTFLPTSLGGFNIQVKDGVLRKFRVLSRVFSLLNISQLFEFNLPDMEDEGMPFERLTGSFSLRQGILATEDLFVKSDAMNLSLVGNYDLVERKQDFVLGVKPLRTVDKIVTQIPIAGWLLTGDEKALITAHFLIGGEPDAPEVLPIPITSVSEKAIGIFKRVLSLPGKLITDPEKVFKGDD